MYEKREIWRRGYVLLANLKDAEINSAIAMDWKKH